ncbi:unnamed protein product [Effrenium voratum]|nr:unnamed protein product [Effrenium voratum]
MATSGSHCMCQRHRHIGQMYDLSYTLQSKHACLASWLYLDCFVLNQHFFASHGMAMPRSLVARRGLAKLATFLSCVMVDRLPVEEGWVYGQKPKEPEAPPDLESLFEAAGVPDKLTNGQPPFSPEWYAGAKERQRLRDLEIEHLLSTRNDARHHWAELVWTDLEIWQDRIDFTVSLPEPLADLQALLARTKHERPGVAAVVHTTHHGLQILEDKVRRREAQDEAAEKERLEIKRLAEKRRRRAERVLKRNEALLRGEDPPPLIEDSDLEPVNAEAFTSPRESFEEHRKSITDESLSPAPPLQRGGLARELPPLQDPPQPPL